MPSLLEHRSCKPNLRSSGPNPNFSNLTTGQCRLASTRQWAPPSPTSPGPHWDKKTSLIPTTPGRLIQQSYYAGSRIDRRKEGQHKAWSPWNWNPIQGGGVGSWAKVTHFEKRGSGNQLYSETIPKLWDMPNEEAAAVMKQQTSFEPGCENAIAVQQQIICHREPGDRWDPRQTKSSGSPRPILHPKLRLFQSLPWRRQVATRTTSHRSAMGNHQLTKTSHGLL